jgi:hypothetical protein
MLGCSGSPVPRHCPDTCLILAYLLLYSGAGHSAVGEARLLRHGGHGGARLPPLGLGQAAVRGHAHHYRLHQVPYTPLKSPGNPPMALGRKKPFQPIGRKFARRLDQVGA